jgi:hypothetical protein
LEQRKYTTSAFTGKLKLLAIIVSSILLFSSCDKQTRTTIKYYNIDSLLKQQVFYLSATQAKLIKEVRLADKIDTTITSLSDSSLWLTELDAFTQLADMNKPINSGVYKVEDQLQDTGSNLTIKSFTGSNELKVEYLKLYYQDSVSKIRKIEALVQDENPLYKHTRKLTMEFQIINNKPILTNYTIQGLQKMFLSDAVDFSIIGTIQIQ